MKYENILKLAVKVNAKEVRQEVFEKKVGVSFYDFLRLKSNHKAFVVEWRAYTKLQREELRNNAKIVKQNKKNYSKECTCDEQFEYLSARTTGEFKSVAWRCNVHGKICKELKS